MANPIGGQDNIEYRIMLEATQAIQNLDTLTATAATLDEKIKMVSASVQQFGQQAGLAPQQALAMFKQVEREAAQLQSMLQELAASGGIPNAIAQNPMVSALAATPQVFKEAPGPMWGQVGVQLKEDEAALAAMNKEGQQLAATFEKDAAAAANMGVNVRSAADNTKALYEFAQGAKGQGILNQMFGDLKGAQSAGQSIHIVKNTMDQLRTATGATTAQVAQLMEQMGVPKFQVTQATKELNEQLSGVPANANRAVHSIDALRIALGAIVAMIVFNVIQAFQEFFRQSIEGARQMEGALYNIRNAERIISQEGIDIAPKDLQEMIDQLQQLIPMINRVDATKAVSSIALFTKDLGYTKDQIGDLTQAIGVLYLRNKSLGLSFEQVRSQVMTGLLTGRAQGIRDLGVSISESAIQAEALRLGLVNTKKEFQDLTGDAMTQVKAQAMLSIVLRNTNQELEAAGKYMETNDAKIGRFTAAWQNLGLTLGKQGSAILGILADIGTGIINTGLKMRELGITILAAVATPLITVVQLLRGDIQGIDEFTAALQKNFNIMKDGLMVSFGMSEGIDQMKDTATGAANSTDDLASSLVDLSKVNLDSLTNSLEGLGDRLNELGAKFDTESARATEDYLTDRARLDQDYAADREKTIQDSQNKQADAEAKYRLEQLMAEKKYQEDLRKLRDQYLFNLEDALRARDARQVLRLQAQYKMDKTALDNQFKLESEQRSKQHQLEMAQMKREADERLAELEREHLTKEARMEEDFQREQARRQEDYEAQKAEIAHEIEDRLKQEADALGDEYNLNDTQKGQLYDLLNKYYGPGGYFDGLYDYSYNSLVSRSSAMLAALGGLIAGFQGLAGSMYANAPGFPVGSFAYPESQAPLNMDVSSPNGWSMNENASGGGYASGGVAFASKPTTATFGDAGPEAALFLPLSKPVGNPRFSGFSPSSGRGGGGLASVILEPSPDFIARVEDNVLDSAGEQIVQVYRRNR